MPEILRYRCIRVKKNGDACGHEWTPDSERPVCCPKCKQYINWKNPETCIEKITSEKPK